MSASPAGGPPSGPPSTTPNGGPPVAMRRRRQAANPFIDKKPVRKAPAPGAPKVAVNGANGTPSSKLSAPPAVQPSNPKPKTQDPDDDPSTYSEFPLVATKKSILEGLRFHAMRLMTTGEANPYDPQQFTRPLRLHRRFPRDVQMQPVPTDNGMDDKEREKEEIKKAERQAQKEVNQAQIAPTEKSAAAKKRPGFKKKVEDVYYPQDTPEAQKRAKLRYEEGRPWHLEDFDGKNSWVGTYEEPLSESHAMFVLDGNGNFRMVPLEKWYRFSATGRYKTMDLDEAEKHMSKKIKDSRWFLENAQGGEVKRRMDQERQQRLERGRVGMRGERMVKNEDDEGDRVDIADDVDEIDFEHDDEFQDDDEGKLFGGDDDEVKESERRVRQEQLGANVFAGTGVKEEKDWDAEEDQKKKEEADERRKAKKLRKHLIKRERKYEYESESDHPYSEESSSEDDSETERLKEEERKKEEEKNSTVNGAPSGASSQGTPTQSGRSENHGSSQMTNGLSLKRPGSPNLSEASGSESTRKRIKKQHKDASGQSSRAMSPSGIGAARSASPNGSAVRKAGSGSDTEASGTERSRPKIRIQKSPTGSPAASVPPSRSASPPAPITGEFPGMPTADQIRAAIPPEGIKVHDLTKAFNSFKKTPESSKEFIRLVKQVAMNSKTQKGFLVQK